METKSSNGQVFYQTRAPRTPTPPNAHGRMADGGLTGRLGRHSERKRGISPAATMVGPHWRQQKGRFGSCSRLGPPSAAPACLPPAAIGPGIAPICMHMHISRQYAWDVAESRVYRNLAGSFCDYAIFPDFSEDYRLKPVTRRIRDRRCPR